MKICEKCGKEIADEILECPNCSIIPLYEQVLKNAKAINIVAIALIVVAIICALFVNAWFGAILCLVAELVCLIPNTKVQKLFKKNNVGISDKKKLKADSKALIKDLKTKNKNYKLSFLVATIALILLIAFVCVDSTLTGLANSLPSDLQEDDYGSGIVNQIDTIVDLNQYANSNFYNYGHNSSDNSSVQAHKGFVGTWEHSRTTNSNTGKEVVPEEPFLEEMEISEWNTVTLTYYGTQEIFNCDGVWTSNEFTDKLIDVTVTETNGKTELHAKTYSLTYHEEQDYIGIVDGDLVHIYSRVGETSSNTTTQSSTSSNNSSSYEKEPIVGSFDYSHSVYADTMSVATIQTPYINHIKFEADGTGNVTIKTDGVSQFAYYDATWSIYDEQENITIYLVTLDNGEVGYVYYAQTEDVCFMIVNNQIVSYYNRY